MISNRLSFNFKLFKEEYKKYIWASALTILAFLFSKIVLPLLDYSNYLYNKKQAMEYNPNSIEEDLLKALNNYLTLDYLFNKFIVIGLAILMGVVIFSYLHNKKKIDFYHSLPISRTSLFFTKYSLGIVVVVPIMIIAHFILYAIFKVALGEFIVPFKEVLEPILVDTVFFIVIYSITIFAIILSGNTIIGVILSGILINLITIILLIIYFLNDLFFNFKIYIYYIFDYNYKYNPLFTYLEMKNNIVHNSITNINFSNLSIVITYIIFLIIITIINLFLFKIRKSESATSCIAFKYAKPILKYLGVCVGGVFVGIVFNAFSRSAFLLYIGVFIGCLILHCIVEIIYEFDFRAIFKNWYSIIACIVISSAICATYQFDIFNRLDYIPKLDKIESVNIDFNGKELKGKNLKDTEIIRSAVELHKIEREISNLKENEKLNVNTTLKIDYKLKNGIIISRYVDSLYYDSQTIEQQRKLINNILSNKEYIESARPILYVDNFKKNDLKVDVTSNRYDNNEYYKPQVCNNEELLKNIRKDVEANGLYTSIEDTLFYIEFSWFERYKYKGDALLESRNCFYITDKYINTLNYLANNCNIYPENFKPEEVKYIYTRYNKNYELVIIDKEGIEKVLANYKIDSLRGFESYIEYVYLNLVTKDGLNYDIIVDHKFYEELKKDYSNSENIEDIEKYFNENFKEKDI